MDLNRIRLPRKISRTLTYALFAVALHFALRYFGWNPLVGPQRVASRERAPVDYAWGSVLHRFQNHQRSAQPRPPFPWTGNRHPRQAENPPRAIIVTSELAGLHKNGGIGTAFLELAKSLSGKGEIQVSILVAHEATAFSFSQRNQLESSLALHNIQLHFVSPHVRPYYPQAWTPGSAIQVLRFLRDHDGDYDVIHFAENTGIGYFSALAKFEGLALQNSKIVVGLHGADVEWAAMLGKRYPKDRYSVEQGYFEKRTAELADIIVSPSEYMLEYVRSRGWNLPPLAFVIPNVLGPITGAIKKSDQGRRSSADVPPITELVFFGRLEERKGIRLFIAALEVLLVNDSPFPDTGIVTVTFLGRDTVDHFTQIPASSLVGPALVELQHQSKRHFDYKFLRDYDREQALEYLQDPSRLAIIPSLSDNSPSTVLECIALGISFIATDVGGVPELINENDREAVLFTPLPFPFATKITEFVTSKVKRHPVRRTRATVTAASDWASLHHWTVSLPRPRPVVSRSTPLVSICVTHFERAEIVTQLLDSLLGQTYQDFEVIMVDDGSSSPDTIAELERIEKEYFGHAGWKLLRIENSYLGEARNKAAEVAKGSHLLFLDDDDVLKPHALQTLVEVSLRTNASALSTWLDEFATNENPLTVMGELPHRRSFYFIGQSISAGLLGNCFGSGNIFVTRQAFDGIAGFSTYRDVGAEDWEFYMRLALAGYSQYVVPEELIYVRSDPRRASMKFSMDPWDASFRALMPLLNDERMQDLDLAHGIMLTKSFVSTTSSRLPFSESQTDYQLTQGWNGWYYYFEPTEATPPKLSKQYLAVATDDQWSVSKNRFGAPYITASAQCPYISERGVAMSAVRSFRSPKSMSVSVRLSYVARHQCGDGTRLLVVYRAAGVGHPARELFVRHTLAHGTDDFQIDLEFNEGSTIDVVTEPLDTDECDQVDVQLTITEVELGIKAWSGLARKAEILSTEAAWQASVATAAPVDSESESEKSELAALAEEWVPVVTPYVEPTAIFHIALIFDAGRFEYAKQVIRSASHFITSRTLHIHILAPESLHDAIYTFFADTPLVLRLYDHAQCYTHVRQILPFSDPDIHISAHCKMFLSEILSMAERVLYLDTDTTIVSDITPCYAEPANPLTLFTMGVDMGDTCQVEPDRCWPIGLYWKVPQGLVCGNVPSRKVVDDPASCASAGDLETLQVNGGVMMLEIGRMKQVGFVERYVESVIQNYRLAGKVAPWGEQDFINSYFRQYPMDLELLPCGCNYQWFGNRREVKCGSQEVHIVHHWSHGLALRTNDSYNALFHHFLDNVEGTAVPTVPSLSISAAGSPNASLATPIVNGNCPQQSYDCSRQTRASQYGEPVTILSRFRSIAFEADLVDSIASQHYHKILHKAAVPEDVELPSSLVPREIFPLDNSKSIDEYASSCRKCGSLNSPLDPCHVAPLLPKERLAYFECVCAQHDSSAAALVELEESVTETGWIIYLDDDKLFTSPESLSLLMAEIDSPNELVVYRINTTSRQQEPDFMKKTFPPSDLSGVGFAFHSSNLEIVQHSTTRCALWASLQSLTQQLHLKWIDLVPVVAHPLDRHLPVVTPHKFQVTVIIFETLGRRFWSPSLLEMLRPREFDALINEVIVVSLDSPQGSFGRGVRVIPLTEGSGLSEIAALVESEGVLLISDDITLEKPAFTSLINFWLDDPLRIVGLFPDTLDGDLFDALATEQDGFDYGSETDPLASASNYSQITPRVLLTSKSHLSNLTSLLSTAPTPLHPLCHGLLLNAVSIKSSEDAPLRILPPVESVIDRIYDCRVRNWADVTPGRQSGQAKEGEQDPTAGECLAAVERLMGEGFLWTGPTSEVGVAGAHGMKVEIVNGESVDLTRWIQSRKLDRCMK